MKADDGVEWLNRNGLDHEFSENQRRCMRALRSALGPVYNWPTLSRPTESIDVRYDQVFVIVRTQIATYDGSEMTNLVIAGHRNAVRIAVSGWSPSFYDPWDRALINSIREHAEYSELEPWEDEDEIPHEAIGALEIQATARTPHMHPGIHLFQRHPTLAQLGRRVAS